MGKEDRRGKRISRNSHRRVRIPKLGYYFIVTDTKETEKNYLLGLKDSLPESIRRNIVIRVIETSTGKLVERCASAVSLLPQYSDPWIVFDRDQIKNFDAIIQEAVNRGISVGWSNPCIEIWFAAYFGKMPNIDTSVKCCEYFSRTFERVTGKEYKKSDSHIYDLLFSKGNEEKAFQIAEQKRAE